MKKFNLVLLVLVAVLFGSSFVACTNSASGGLGDFEFEAPENSGTGNSNNEITAQRDNGDTIKFIPVPDCATVEEVEFWYETTYENTITKASNNLDFNRFVDSENLKNNIRTKFCCRYIIYRRSGVPDKLYELVINGTDVSLIATDTSSATVE